MAAKMASFRASSKLFTPPPFRHYPTLQFSINFSAFPKTQKIKRRNNLSSSTRQPLTILCCSSSTTQSPPTARKDEVEKSPALTGSALPLRRKRRRYRKLYPGEKEGITEEMRFIAMKLRNTANKPRRRRRKKKDEENSEESEYESLDEEENGSECEEEGDDGNGNDNGESWQPSMEGLLKYLVDNKLVFSTIERIVDDSHDVSYAYFRKTGLERVESLSKDLEWFRDEGNSIPEPSSPGITYAKYLEELSDQSPNLFLCHFYNIYFSHIAGGQVIARRVSEKLLEGRELEFCRWEGKEEEFLRDVREKLNMLGEHWTRDEKNKCLREATKAFRHLGQIVRLIIL